MTASQSHTLCTHPATKAARAKCRAARRTLSTERRDTLNAALNSYYDNTGEIHEIASTIDRIAIESRSESLLAAARGYYDESLTFDEVLALAHQGVNEI